MSGQVEAIFESLDLFSEYETTAARFDYVAFAVMIVMLLRILHATKVRNQLLRKKEGSILGHQPSEPSLARCASLFFSFWCSLTLLLTWCVHICFSAAKSNANLLPFSIDCMGMLAFCL